MSRETRRADEIKPGQYVIDAGTLQLVTYVQHARGTVMLVLAGNWAECGRPDRPVTLATAAEVFEAAAEAQASGRGLHNFPGLSRTIGPVEQVFGPMYAERPAGEFGPDDLDEKRERVVELAKTAEPVRPQTLAEVVELVERRDAVGAFPVVAGHAHTYGMACPVEGCRWPAEGRLVGEGFSVSDGHRPTPPPESLTADRYGNGLQGAYDDPAVQRAIADTIRDSREA